MKTKITLTVLIILFLLKLRAQPCQSGLVHQFMQFNSAPNTALFKDKSLAPSNWQREYTHWDFGDGTQDTSKFIFHTFPQNIIYKVKKETKFSDIFNPSNYCVLKDSIMVDVAFSAPTSSCMPSGYSIKSKVLWLTGSTYGISTIYGSNCPYNIKEIALIKGDTVTSGTDSLTKSVFATSHSFAAITIPNDLSNYNIVFHLANNNLLWTAQKNIYRDSIPNTPTNCHAKFFLVPNDYSLNNWTLQDFSSGSDSLSYFWDFGDGNTSTSNLPSHTYSATGVYTICLTVSTPSCSDTYCSSALVDTMIAGHGISTLNSMKMLLTNKKEIAGDKKKLSVYPNPAIKDISISYPYKNEDYTISITNLLGENLLHTKFNDIDNKVNIESLTNGIYFLQIHSSNGEVLAKTKFIKE